MDRRSKNQTPEPPSPPFPPVENTPIPNPQSPIPDLPSSLPPFLPSFFPHFLTSSLPHFLTPSLPHFPIPFVKLARFVVPPSQKPQRLSAFAVHPSPSSARHRFLNPSIRQSVVKNPITPATRNPPPSRTVGVPPTTLGESKPSSCLHPSKSGGETRGNPVGRRPHPGSRIHLTRPAGKKNNRCQK